MSERPSTDAGEARPPGDEGDDLAAALAAVFEMSWEARDADAGTQVGAGFGEWSPEPARWAPDAAPVDWSPQAAPEPAPPDAAPATWTPANTFSEWSPPAAFQAEAEPQDPGSSDWWNAGSTDAAASAANVDLDAGPDASSEAGAEAGPRRASEPEAAAAALHDAGLASPLTSALGTLGRVIPGPGGDPVSSPAGRPEAEERGGRSPRRLPEWLSVAAWRDAWTTHRREWAPGLVVAALVVVAFAVVLAAGGRNDTDSQVSTKPQPSVTSPATTFEVPTTLAPETTVAVEEAPDDGVGDGTAASPSAPGRSASRGRTTPARAPAKPKAASPAPAPARAPARAPAPAPAAAPAAAPEPPPPPSGTDGVHNPPGDTDGSADPDPHPAPDPAPPEPPDSQARCLNVPRAERADCLRNL